MRIFIFIHVALFERGATIFRRQLHRITEAGLYDAAEAVKLGVVGSIGNDLGNLPSKVEISVSSRNLKAFEFPTLNLLHQHCLHGPNCYVLYLHTKGASDKHLRSNKWPVDQIPTTKSQRWREAMEEVVIDRWRECIATLESGADTCGTIYANRHYSGNFWWARSEHISRLSYLGHHRDVPSVEQTDCSKLWLCDNKKPAKLFFVDSGVEEVSQFTTPSPEVHCCQSTIRSMQNTNESLPPKLEELVELFESLQEQERRENLIALATSASQWLPQPDERFLVSDDRTDPDCTDRIAIYLNYGNSNKLKIRVQLGPNVQTITRALVAILCKALSGEEPESVLKLSPEFISRIVGEELTRTRSRSINYIFNRIKAAVQHLVGLKNPEVLSHSNQ